VTAELAAAAATESPAPAPRRRSRFELRAVTMLQVEVWLLVLIPNHLVIGPLGGMGSPALLLALIFFGWWFVSAVSPNIGVVRTCVPLRVVLGCLWFILFVSYGALNTHAVPGDEGANATRFLITMTAFGGLVLVAAEGLRDLEEVRRVIRTIVAGVAVMAVVGILQFQPGIDLTTYVAKIPLLTSRGDLSALSERGSFTRPSSTALHPIEFGVIVASTLAFAVHILLYDTVWKKWHKRLAVACIGFAVPVSISRSALFAALIVLLYFFIGTTQAIRRRGYAVLGVFLMFVFVAVPGMLGTLAGYVTAGSSDDSITTRTDDYGYTANFINKSPWIGRGPGTFLAGKFHTLDNQFLLTLVEIGVLGLFCVIAVLATPMFLGRGLRKRSTDEEGRSLGQMIAAAAAAMLASAGTFDALSFPTFTAMAALILGLSGAAWCSKREELAAVARAPAVAASPPVSGPNASTVGPAIEAGAPEVETHGPVPAIPMVDALL
jgi:O-antigen ligase